MARHSLTLPTSYELVVSPSQRHVASLGRNVVLADLESWKRLQSWHPLSHPSHVAFSHEESSLAVKSTSGEIVSLCLTDGRILARHRPRHRDEGVALHYSACDSYLIDASWSGFIRVRTAADLKICNEFEFPNEMITEVSPSANRKLWVFAHVPKAYREINSAPQPYLTIWRWPLRKPLATLAVNFDILYAAALSPCGSFIATVGHCRSKSSTELRVATSEGHVLRAVSTSTGGTGSKTRWSPDSEMIGTVRAGGFSVLESTSLKMSATFETEYPADLAFVENNTSILLGTWQSGMVFPLNGRDA